MTVDWPGYGPSQTRVDADASGYATAAVNPRYLQELVGAALGWDVTLRIPVDPGSPLTLRGGSFAGALMPLRDRPDAEGLLRRLQEIVAEELGVGAAELDEDGNLPLPFEYQQLFLRVAPGDPPVAQLFAVLAEVDDDADAEVAVRLNELNAAVRHARLFAVNGQVLVEADLPEDPEAFDVRRAAATIAGHPRMLRRSSPRPSDGIPAAKLSVQEAPAQVRSKVRIQSDVRDWPADRHATCNAKQGANARPMRPTFVGNQWRSPLERGLVATAQTKGAA